MKETNMKGDISNVKSACQNPDPILFIMIFYMIIIFWHYKPFHDLYANILNKAFSYHLRKWVRMGTH